MEPIAGVALVAVVILSLGGFGAPLIRRATPALVKFPRLAIVLLSTVALVWLLALAAIGPMVTWVISGPAVLPPGATAELCQQCLAAASPLPDGAAMDTVIPAVLLLALPLGLLVTVAVSTLRALLQRQADLKATQQMVSEADSQRSVLLGFPVVKIAHPAPIAFALPGFHGGIVVSEGLVELLSREELQAVLTHEQAHLHQRHHLVLLVLEAVTQPVRWIPLMRAIADSVPHYVEIAADDAARARSGTQSLASALLKLGDRPYSLDTTRQARTAGLVLHAAGADRIRHLVAPETQQGGMGYAIAVVATIALMTTTSTAVHGNYAQAVLSGCTL